MQAGGTQRHVDTAFVGDCSKLLTDWLDMYVLDYGIPLSQCNHGSMALLLPCSAHLPFPCWCDPNVPHNTTRLIIQPLPPHLHRCSLQTALLNCPTITTHRASHHYFVPGQSTHVCTQLPYIIRYHIPMHIINPPSATEQAHRSHYVNSLRHTLYGRRRMRASSSLAYRHQWWPMPRKGALGRGTRSVVYTTDCAEGREGGRG